jgi:myo-inositol-1(or 4)-monophosphatase
MLTESAQRSYLARIERALAAASEVAARFAPGSFEVRDDGGRNVVTEVDRRISHALRAELLAEGEGWLSEEDPDDRSRLAYDVVWIVDPLDGTREFVDGIPEWSISVGLVVEGVAVAGGTCNPSTKELFLGALDCGVTYNGQPAFISPRSDLAGAVVLASRQEHKRGEWQRFDGFGIHIRPMGSVAYKLSRVAAGLADATWTVSPKHEWDVAAGVALVNSAGGICGAVADANLRFNRREPSLPGLAATAPGIWSEALRLIGETSLAQS